MKLTKRRLNAIIKESIYSSKPYANQSSHEKFLDREREKQYLQSPEYYEQKMKEYSVDLLETFIEQDEEEFQYYEEKLGSDDVDAIVEIYEGLIRKLRSIK